MEKVLYGFRFHITPEKVEVGKLLGNVATETSKAFCALKEVGRFSRSCFDIMTNEVVRGRLDPKDEEAIQDLNKMILKIERCGMTVKDIVILRSCYFSFEDILKYAKEGKTADDVLQEEGIEDPEIELVYGVTAYNMRKWYTTYEAAKEVDVE